MKNKIKQFLPTSVQRALKQVVNPLRRYKERWELRHEFRLDRKRYARYMLPSDGLAHSGMSSRQLEGQLTKDYHRIEKGLALKAPKRPFGEAVIGRLTDLEAGAKGQTYHDNVTTALTALYQWNQRGEVDETVSPLRAQEWEGLSEPEPFFMTRHSVRDYCDKQISQELLERATTMAINTPSVCNRQSWSVRYFSGEQAANLLKHQNGNRGFGDTVPVVAMVTVDTQLFAAPGERNQPWIEGGLFSMSLVWAFHALGIDSCMLNMSITNAKAQDVRNELDINDAEQIIMLIALGYGREGHRRARSPRRSTTDAVQQWP